MISFIVVDQDNLIVRTGSRQTEEQIKADVLVGSNQRLIVGLHGIAGGGYLEGKEVKAFPAKPSEDHVWDTKQKQWVVSPLLQLQKLLTEARESYEAEISLPVKFEGDSFDADDESVKAIQHRITQLSLSDSLPEGWQGWKTLSNSFVWGKLNPPEVRKKLTELLQVIDARNQSSLVKWWANKDSIRKSLRF